MPAHAYEEAIELRFGVIEPLDLAAGVRTPSYPLPQLRATGRIESRTFRALVLENTFLRVRVLPDLGGRIYSFTDLRTGKEALPGGDLLPVPGSDRGVQLLKGIELSFQGGPRPNALGSVAFQIRADEEEGAEIWIAESTGYGPFAFHQRFHLGERPVLQIETRVQNRSWQSVPYNGTFFMPVDAAIAVVSEDLPHRTEGARRFSREVLLGPRQVDTWKADVFFFEAEVVAANAEVVIGVAPGRLVIMSTSDRKDHRVQLRERSGATHEATVSLSVAERLELDLGGLEPQSVALVDGSGHIVLRAELDASASALPDPEPGYASVDIDADASLLRIAAFDPALRSPAHVALGIGALGQGDLERADWAFEQALLFNGEDPLAWWALGATRRQRGSEEGPERLNAHYLAPLEPMLRAEAFLGQPMTLGAEPSPLAGPLAEFPDDLVGVASVLLEHRMYQEASRWIDEALRHRDLAMLRYLLAYALLTETRMEAEAAEQIRAARSSIAPPLPWRPVERRAIEVLVKRFPEEPQLVGMADVLANNP